MMILTLHNADDVSAHAIEIARTLTNNDVYLENTLPPIGPSYGWIGFSKHTEFAFEIDGDQKHRDARSTVFQCEKAASPLLKLPCNAQCPADLHCYIATLPDHLTNLLDGAGRDRGQIQSTIENILGVSVLDGRDCEDDYLNMALGPLNDKLAFDLLRGCILVLRHLRQFDAEAKLLLRALEIRSSNNLQFLLSRALANAQDYQGAAEAASQVVFDKSDPKNDAFEDHLRELQSFESVEKEALDLLSRESSYKKRQSSRVAYCLHNTLPYRHGGYAIRSHAIAKSLLASGQDLIAFARPGFPSDGQYCQSENADEISTEGVTYRFHNDFGRRRRAYQYIARSADYFEDVFGKESIDLVHAATNFWTALPAGIAAKRLNLPFIYEVRSFWGMAREAREPGFLATPQARRDENLERVTLSLADHVLTLTEVMRRHLSSYGVAPEKVSLAPNCVDADRFVLQSRNPELSKRFGIEPDDLVIGYIGTMLDYEGLDLLVEAAAPILSQNRKIQMLLIGADMEKLRHNSGTEGRLMRQISEMGMEDQVQLAGSIPSEATPIHYGLFDICAYPRRKHDVCEMVSPLKPLEAMAAGKAVILSDVGGMQEMVLPDETGLLCRADDVESLRNRLAQLIDDPVLRNEITQNAQRFVRDKRNWEKTTDEIMDAYSIFDS